MTTLAWLARLITDRQDQERREGGSAREASAAGFSLIEVITAFIIASICLTLVFRVVGQTSAAQQRLSDQLQAAALAQTKLAEIGVTEPLKIGQSEGAFDDIYSWRLNISASHRLLEAHAETPIVAMKVHLTVGWQRDGQAHEIELNTLRLKSLRGDPNG